MRSRFGAGDRAAVAAALAAPLAVAAVVLPFRASWPNANVALLLVVVVVAAVAVVANRIAGALAAVCAAAWFDFFFIMPYDRFTLRGSAGAATAGLLLLAGLAVSQLAAHYRRVRAIVITDAGYLTLVTETTALARSARAPMVVADQVQEQLAVLLGLEESRFERGPPRGRSPRLEADGAVMAGHQRWDVDRAGLPGEVELLVSGHGRRYGRFLLRPRPGSKPSLQARRVAARLADLVGQAFTASDPARSAR
jgi:uncharacterized protein DUF4118